jgi:hypothetical protein
MNFLSGVEEDIEFCRPLLKIRNGSVQFVHPSAKTFLLRCRSSNAVISNFLPIESIAHYKMSVACLTYLLRENLSEIPLRATNKEEQEKEYNSLLDKYPFLEYACTY